MLASTNYARPGSEPALSRLREVLLAIPAAQVLKLNVNVPDAVATITASLPRVRLLLPQMVVELPEFNITVLDTLPEYVSALAQAHARCQTVAKGSHPKVLLLGQARKLRNMLLADATALVRRGLVDGGVLRYRLHANGYCGIAQDLELVASALKTAWPRIQGRNPNTLADLDGALELAARLRNPAPLEQAEAWHADARDLRARAFTLTARAYREIRRAVCYLREPQGDADEFAPRLRTGRGGAS